MPAPAISCSSTISARPAGKGWRSIDFSVGDEPYKRLWCDIETRHFDVVVPLTAKGRLLAAAMRLTGRLKAFVKNSPTVWKLTKLLRKTAAGQPQPSEDRSGDRLIRPPSRSRHRRIRRPVRSAGDTSITPPRSRAPSAPPPLAAVSSSGSITLTMISVPSADQPADAFGIGRAAFDHDDVIGAWSATP